jgi:hypothetical protein
MLANDYNQRRFLKCGYVQREDWLPSDKRWGYVGGSSVHEPETCPGYTTRLPAVLEVAEAWSWWERGQLGMRGDLDSSLVSLVSTLNAEINASRDYYREETAPKK